MAEDMDLSSAVDMLKNMLGSNEGQEQLQNIVSMFTGGQEEQKSSPPDFNPQDIEMMMKLKKVMTEVSKGENSRQAVFLRSLAPLLKQDRRDKLSNAVRLLSVGSAIRSLK